MTLTRRQVPYTSQIGQYAGFVTRLLAFIVDSTIISGVLFFASWFISTTLSMLQIRSILNELGRFWPALRDLPSLLSNPLTVSLASILFIFAYHVFFWYAAGQTPGKAVMGVRVAHMRGPRKSIWRAVLRYLGYFVSGVPLGLGFFWILIDDRRMGWHDKIAGTCVIYTWDARPDETFLSGPIQMIKARQAALKAYLARRRGG